MNDQVDDGLFDLLASTVGPLGLELVDVELRPALVRVVVDRRQGADLDRIAEATRAVSAALDRHDPFPGHRYTLEVTSPGVERPLRRPRDFARAVGETVTVRTRAGGEGERRFTGRLAVADTTGFLLESDERAVDDAAGAPTEARRFAYAEVERARTVFEWGPSSPRPGRTRRARAASGKVGHR